MTLILPSDAPVVSMAVGMVSAKNVMTPAFGGDDQELLRKGTRHALTYRLMMPSVDSMDWVDLSTEGETVLMPVYQPNFDTGAPGTPLVAGAGQAGTSLEIDGLTPHYVIRKGQFLNVVTGGQYFLYRAKAEVVASAAGLATVSLQTMLRRPPADNDTIVLAEPMVEGFVRDLGSWEVDGHWIVTLEFTVRERE